MGKPWKGFVGRCKAPKSPISYSNAVGFRAFLCRIDDRQFALGGPFLAIELSICHIPTLLIVSNRGRVSCMHDAPAKNWSVLRARQLCKDDTVEGMLVSCSVFFYCCRCSFGVE